MAIFQPKILASKGVQEFRDSEVAAAAVATNQASEIDKAWNLEYPSAMITIFGLSKVDEAYGVTLEWPLAANSQRSTNAIWTRAKSHQEKNQEASLDTLW